MRKIYLFLAIFCSIAVQADNYYIISAKCNVPLTAGMSGATHQILVSNGTTVSTTTAISVSLTGESGFYYNSTSIKYSELTKTSNYSSSSSSSRTMSGIKIGSSKELTIDLKTKTFVKIDVIYMCASSNACKLTIDGVDCSTSDKNVHKITIEKNYSSSIKISNSSPQDYRVFVILTEYVPTYSVTYEENGHGSVTDLAGQYTLPNPLPVLTATGWTFGGWYAESSLITPVTAGGTLTQDTVLYARWTIYKEVPITFVAEGATNNYTKTATALLGGAMPPIAVLPVLPGFEFAGYYDGVGGTGKQYYSPTGASVCNWDKDVTAATLYAKWSYPSYQYILGYCYLKNGVWTQGTNGEMNAWRCMEENDKTNLVKTNDIGFGDIKSTGLFFNTMDLTQLNNESYWTTSSSSNRAITGFLASKNSTVIFELGSLQVNKIIYYLSPASNEAYTIELTHNGTTEVKNIAAGNEKKILRFVYDSDTYIGEFSIRSNSKDTRCVIVLCVPPAVISYNGNGGIGYMEDQVVPKGLSVKLSQNTFTMPGMVFGGWTEDPANTGAVIPNRGTFSAIEDATLYAKWVTLCEAAPTLKPTLERITIWDNKKVDMRIMDLQCDFDTTEVKFSLVSVSPSIPGCIYKYKDSRLYLIGTPALGNTSTIDQEITITFQNNCSPSSSFSLIQTIRIHPANQKPKVAFIVTGTEGGAFTAYDAADKAACNTLLDYLDDFYDITCVNGYATKDPTRIAEYYSQYDLLIVTDFLNTEKGYTNAIGTLIDKKPILSFEAYVAKQSNWHIDSNPVDPSPKVKDMKVLCAGHAVFGDAEGIDVVNDADTTVHVLDQLSSAGEAKGLQGFVINEAPDFLFLATIRDKNRKRDLIVCCERQIVFPARLMLYGINHYEMGNLSHAGKIVMRQMIDYLLLTDESGMADCSLVFDDHHGTHVWSDKYNWAPGYNIIPTPYHPTRIIKPCQVDIANAHAGSVKINQGEDEFGSELNGQITILPQGGLTVAGFVNKVMDTRFASLLETTTSDIVIQADENHNGAFVYGNKESDVQATVQYYSRGEGAKTSSPVWQYMGIPVQASKTAIAMYRGSWMCRWTENTTDDIGGLWEWVDNEDVLIPFEGYCITQEAKKTFTLTGKLNEPQTWVVRLDNCDEDGYAFAANSWTAPIKIKEMTDDDFTNAEKSIYIYHSGTYANWEANNTTNGQVATLPGQYAVVPIHASPYLTGADSVIPSMQGFFVKRTAPNARIALVYKQAVYDSKYFTTSTQPMRAPRRVAQDESGLQVMRLMLAGEHYGDQLYLLSHSDFSEQYEDGWDGRKLQGIDEAPYLSFVKNADTLAVAAIASADNRELLFRAGMDEQYTFSFDYDGETIYLYDRLTDQATEIKTGNTYTFTAENRTPAKRFLITTTPPRIPTGIENTEYRVQNTDVEKCIIDGQLYIIKDNRFYDARGVRVSSLK